MATSNDGVGLQDENILFEQQQVITVSIALVSGLCILAAACVL